MLTSTFFLSEPGRVSDPSDDDYRARNLHLCRAVNLTALSVELSRLVAAGMPRTQADCFYAQADALLQLLRTENNRLRADEVMAARANAPQPPTQQGGG